MKLSRWIMTAVALAGAAACRDTTTAPVKPAAISLIAGESLSGTVGQKLAVSPSFTVNDAAGNPIAGVRVDVAVTLGDGTIADAPVRSADGPRSVGVWTLGRRAGANTLTVTVEGLPPLVVSATASAGSVARLVANTPMVLSGRVGEIASPAPSVRVLDAYDNTVASATLSVALSGGGAAVPTIVADAQGVAVIPEWRFGTVAGSAVLTLASGAASASFTAALAPADPAAIVVTGADQRARAGAPVGPISLRVTDKYGNTVRNQTASFTLTAGGGTLAAPTAASGADGSIALPPWTLGRSAVPQTVHAVVGALAADVSVTIATSYNIDVRFFGDAMTDAQRAWFTNAAARISGIVTGDVPNVSVANLDVASACGIAGPPTLNETIDDIVIYASVSSIDGAGRILAEAGPCVFRNAASGGLTAVGVMLFDSADMDRMARDNITQDVITHEMLHVVGVGTLWQDRNLITAAGTPAVTYWGGQAKQGCLGAGGAATCATSVPVENNLVPGTTDSHWRESTFGNELMTGYANVGGMPLSAITVGSLGDIGYETNILAADPFQITTSAVGTANRIPGRGVTEDWEKPLPRGVILGARASDRPTLLQPTAR